MIVVFGSINVDLVFRVDTLPRCGETALTETCAIHPGGKGANTAVAAARAGGETVMAGLVGQDRFAEHALRVMRASGVDLACVGESRHPTGCASVCVDRCGDNVIVVASGANRDVASSLVPDSLLGNDTLVALQMEVPPEENWSLVERAKAAGARVLLNLAPTQRMPAHTLKRLDILVVNQGEAETLAGWLKVARGEPLHTARAIAERYGVTCVVTLGRTGAVAGYVGGGWRIPALTIGNAVDTTGAGDAFCGALAAALDQRMDIQTALRFASIGAGLACTAEGAQSSLPDRAAIVSRLGDLPDLQPV